jgi:hypothetical protein
MPLRPLSDLSPADWFSENVTQESVVLGPPGYDAYVRVLHRDDDGDRHEGHLDDALLTALCQVLARHTSTPQTCYFGLWEGYGDITGGDAVGFLTAFSGSARWPRVFRPEKKPPPPPPAFAPRIVDGPKVDFFHRYLLFTGPIDEAGQWGARPYGPGIPRDINSPNLMWPADHAWFVTTNIDSEWTGVGGSAALADDLLREPSLEVVRTRYESKESR